MLDVFMRGTAMCRRGLDFVGGPSAIGGAPEPAQPADPVLEQRERSRRDRRVRRRRRPHVPGLRRMGSPTARSVTATPTTCYRAFSELAAAMNPTNAWQLVEGDPNLPHIWVPQPVNPTVYCEVEWAGIYPEWSDRGFGLGDFPRELPGGDDASARSITSCALTYYYLYPMRDVPPEGGDVTRRSKGSGKPSHCSSSGDPGPIGDVRTADAVHVPRTAGVRRHQQRHRALVRPRRCSNIRTRYAVGRRSSASTAIR